MGSCLIFTTNSFFMSKKDFKMIIENAKAYDNDETGGNLFGNDDRHGNPIAFKVISPISNCKRTPTSFIIDKEYAISITREQEDKGLYNLGNWHSHKGYGGPSHGDDMECKKFLEINKHKKKVVSFIVDIHGTQLDIYVVSYEIKNNHIFKKHLNLVLISSKKLKRLAMKYLSTISFTQRITEHLEKILKRECKIMHRVITREFIIQIPFYVNQQQQLHQQNRAIKEKEEKVVKEINSDTIRTTKENIELFIYLSIPSFIDFLKDKQQEDKILIGITSKDYSTDVSLCKFQFKHLFSPSIIIDVIQRIVENSQKCIKMTLSQYLLKEIIVN
jgi:hypothetical protein